MIATCLGEVRRNNISGALGSSVLMTAYRDESYLLPQSKHFPFLVFNVYRYKSILLQQRGMSAIHYTHRLLVMV